MINISVQGGFMRVFSIRKEKILICVYILLIIFGLFHNYSKETVSTFFMPVSKKIIVIDAGHGGFDPGKIAKGDIYEKDINLSIALKLQKYLEQNGATVIMTRTEEDALSNTKNEDMNRRKEIINSGKGHILISIHQNSFPEESARGAQVFYYNDESQSKILANLIQDEFKNISDYENKRSAKANSDYYILRETNLPAVIIECGFLSNMAELNLLNSDEYQEKVAWGIYKGVISFFNNSSIN